MKLNAKKLVVCFAIAKIAATITICSLGLRPARTVWPHFDEQAPASGAPQSVISLRNGRDFGYRTGHLVPVEICFKVPKGTELDVDSITLAAPPPVRAQSKREESDKGEPQPGAGKDKQAPQPVTPPPKQVFKIVRRQSLSAKGDGGTRYVQLDIDLQSMIYQPKWSAAFNINYRVGSGGKIQTLTTDSIVVSVSHTFDGEKNAHPKDPQLSTLQGNHLLVTTGWLAVGALGMAGSLAYLILTRRRKVRAAPPPAEVDPWLAVVLSWQVIEKGNRTKEAFDGLAAAARLFFKAGNRSPGELFALGTALDCHAATILQVCEEASWGDCQITDERLQPVAQVITMLSSEGKPEVKK
jgi:hypothetical protein